MLCGRWLVLRLPPTPSISSEICLGVSWREPPRRAHGFQGHLQATQSRPDLRRDRRLGGNLNAATDHEHTNYRALVPYTYMDTALEVLTDMLRGSEHKSEEVAKERDVILEEIDFTFDSPSDIADLEFDALMWPDHPLGKDVAGTKATVKRITRDDLVAHIEKNYRPDALVVSVAGNVTHAAGCRFHSPPLERYASFRKRPSSP